MRQITVDGAPGAIVMTDGKPTTVMAFETRKGMITRIRSVTDPERLAQIVPSWVSWSPANSRDTTRKAGITSPASHPVCSSHTRLGVSEVAQRAAP